MSAHIQILDSPQVLVGNEERTPHLLVSLRVYLDCGCCVFQGTRLDNGEVAISTFACRPEHVQLCQHFTMLVQESLVEPEDRALVAVVGEKLEEAEKWWSE